MTYKVTGEKVTQIILAWPYAAVRRLATGIQKFQEVASYWNTKSCVHLDYWKGTNYHIMTSSEKHCSNPGVPQGSELGPALFLIYNTDITTNIRSELQLFAEVILIYRPTYTFIKWSDISVRWLNYSNNMGKWMADEL